MTLKIPRGDRREHVRFEVGGQLWATLNFADEAPVRNVATGGVSIETTQRSAFRQTFAARIVLPGGPTIDAIVRHLSHAAHLPGDDGIHVVGLEFVNLSPAARLFIERMIRDWPAGSGS